MSAKFQKNAEGVKLLAVYLSELTRQGVTYLVDNKTNEYEVTIQGY